MATAITETVGTHQGMFSGRMGRLNYFLGVALAWLLLLLPSVVSFILAIVLTAFSSTWSLLLLVPALTLACLFIIVAISAGARRLHDFNASGLWLFAYILLSVVPMVQFVFTLALLAVPGDEGNNKFGEPPVGGFNLRRIWFGS